MTRAALLIAVLVLLAGCANRGTFSPPLGSNEQELAPTEPAQTRSAIASQAVWGGGVLFAGGALAAIASSVIPIVPRAAAWTAMALGGGAWGLALLVSYTGYLDAWARWVVPVAFLAAVAGLAWVGSDWFRRWRVKQDGTRLFEQDPRAGTAVMASVDPKVKRHRKTIAEGAEKFAARRAAEAEA